MADIIDLFGSLKWANPIIWPNCGKSEPPDNLKRDGMLAFADGVNWNPGQGKGFYYWDTVTSAWVKFGEGGGGDMLKAVYDTNDNNVVDNAEKVSGSYFRIQQVDNDLWITANAYYDGTDWQRIDTSRFSFGIQVQGYNNIPGESIQGINFWRAVPGSNPIGDFGEYGGWEAVQLWTAYKDAVLGGYGLEIDGHGTFPYGRFVHLTYNSEEWTGIITNLFADMSGRDDSNEPSWFIGRKGDEFVIMRMPSGSGSLVKKLRIDANGNTFIYPLTEEPADSAMQDGELVFFVDLNAAALKGKYRYSSSQIWTFTVATMY